MPQRYILFFLVVCTINFFGVKSINIVKSLTLLLDNIIYSYNLSVDINFGVNIAYKLLWGNYSILKLKSDRNYFYWKTLDNLRVLKNRGHSQNVSVYGEILLESIAKTSDKWRRPMKYLQLEKSANSGSLFNYERFVNKGFPTKIQSDKCIAQLASTKTCAISSKCVAMMTSDTPSYGYHKTHKVLFLLIMLLKTCSNHLAMDHSIDVIVAKQCSDILIEHYTLRRNHIPKEFHDLFMEQALLCGMAGHSEFLSSATINPVIQWQSSNGCFGTNLEGTESNCMSHIDSLAIAFYSHLIARANNIF